MRRSSAEEEAKLAAAKVKLQKCQILIEFLILFNFWFIGEAAELHETGVGTPVQVLHLLAGEGGFMILNILIVEGEALCERE